MDYDRIVSLVNRIKLEPEHADITTALSNLLWCARIVSPLAIDHDVITLNSRVKVRDIESGQARVIDVAFPDESPDGGDLRVISIVDASLLGRGEGEIVCVPTDETEMNLSIERIMFQPESTVAHRDKAPVREPHREGIDHG